VKIATIIENIKIPFSEFKADSALLLPRPYPGFLPVSFKGSGIKIFSIKEIERIQVTTTAKANNDFAIQLESIWLESKE
jgi:hypothetical protein